MKIIVLSCNRWNFFEMSLFSHYFMIFKRKQKGFTEVEGLANSQYVRSAYNHRAKNKD